MFTYKFFNVYAVQLLPHGSIIKLDLVILAKGNCKVAYNKLYPVFKFYLIYLTPFNITIVSHFLFICFGCGNIAISLSILLLQIFFKIKH